MNVPYRELVELHQFIHTFEYEVLIPLLSTRKLSSFIRVEEYLNTKINKHKVNNFGGVLGFSVASDLVFAIDYYGYLKKSFGLLSQHETQKNVPIILFEKIPESWLLSKFSAKIVAPEVRKHKKNILKLLYKEKYHEHTYRLGKKVIRPRKARGFEGLWELED